MIKELAKKVVRDGHMNSAIESAEKYSDYLISLYESGLLTHLNNSESYACYNSNMILQINNELSIIKDDNSRELLLKECSQLLQMNSLQEIL